MTRRLTGAERELLAAVRAVIEIPYPADHEPDSAFEAALRERMFRLIGTLGNLDTGTYEVYLTLLQDLAGWPLGYEPEPPDQASSRPDPPPVA